MKMMMKKIREFMNRRLRERCVRYADGDVENAVRLFRYIKDGTIKVCDPLKNTVHVLDTYP